MQEVAVSKTEIAAPSSVMLGTEQKDSNNQSFSDFLNKNLETPEPQKYTPPEDKFKPVVPVKDKSHTGAREANKEELKELEPKEEVTPIKTLPSESDRAADSKESSKEQNELSELDGKKALDSVKDETKDSEGKKSWLDIALHYADQAKNRESHIADSAELIKTQHSESDASTLRVKGEKSLFTEAGNNSQKPNEELRMLLEKRGVNADKVESLLNSVESLAELKKWLTQSLQQGAVSNRDIMAKVEQLANKQEIPLPVDPEVPVAQVDKKKLSDNVETILPVDPEKTSSDTINPQVKKQADQSQLADVEKKPLVSEARVNSEQQKVAEQTLVEKVGEQAATIATEKSASNGDSSKPQVIAKSDKKPVTANEIKLPVEADKTVEMLVQLPPEQQQKAVEQIARSLPLTDNANRQSFIDNLKGQLQDLKQQARNGSELKVDLTTVVADAMPAEVTIGKEVVQQQLQPQVQKFQAVLEQFSSPVRTDSAQASVYERAVSQTTETQKSAEVTKPQTAPLDKAINIATADGAKQLAERVRVMVNQGNLTADIRLDPPDLGGMQVRISLSGEQANVSFTVQSQQARDVLEQQAPRLREMLQEKGIELGQSSVQKDNKGQQEGEHAKQTGSGSEAEVIEEQVIAESPVVNGRMGGIYTVV